MVSTSVMDLQSWLTGDWRIDRSVRHADGQFSMFAGSATFSNRADGALDYCESGVHRVRDQELPAEQRYVYGFSEPGVAEVRFGDGRFFHTMRLSSRPATALHVCGDDHYSGTFRTVGEAAWEAIWDVRGPSKQYVSTTLFERAVSAS
jgi:hypothetical protein